MKLQIIDTKQSSFLVNDETGRTMIADNINREFFEEVITRVNIHEELIEFVSRVIGCMALERVERFDLVEMGKKLTEKQG